MKRSGFVRAALVILVALVVTIPPPPELRVTAHPPRPAAPLHRPGMIPASLGTDDDADAQAEMEFRMLRDPLANAIPRDIHRREIAFARALPVRRARPLRSGPGPESAAQTLVWAERGPNNVGGRTRAFAVDVSSPTTLLAGSVAGGIWRSTDDGASWSQRLSPGQIHGTTCIAQDRRAGSTGTWYVGTGEIRGSTTNATRWGSLYLGDGIFKSTDGGLTWTLLPWTSSGTPQTADPFDFVIDVATNPANAGQDEVLELRIALYVGNMDHRAIEDCPAGPQGSGWTCRIDTLDLLQGLGSVVVPSNAIDQLAVEPVECAEKSSAQPHRTFDDRVEDGLHVGLRLTDDTQDLARCGLLLQRLRYLRMGVGERTILLLQLREQPDVLDRNHGLVGEGLEQRDLSLREEMCLGAADVDGADRDTFFSDQGDAQYRAVAHAPCILTALREFGLLLSQQQMHHEA